MATGVAKTSSKRRLRRLRHEERRLKNYMNHLYSTICAELEATLPPYYRCYYDVKTQGIVVVNCKWLHDLAERQYENASHWLNEQAIWSLR